MSQYVQTACEELSENPEAPSRDAYAVLLEVLLDVRELRSKECVGLDRYYLGNLGLSDAVTRGDRAFGSDAVALAITRLVQQLRDSGHAEKPVFAGRNLHAALRDEALADMVALNEVLLAHMETLFRLAARGHWIRERRPLHAEGATAAMRESVCQLSDGMRLVFSDDPTGGLSAILHVERRQLQYRLKSYPEIVEFSAMLQCLQQRRTWAGPKFCGGIIDDFSRGGYRSYFFRYDDGVELIFSVEECRTLHDSFAAALAAPELQSKLAELALVYGDL
jgi:hypothetical protein